MKSVPVLLLLLFLFSSCQDATAPAEMTDTTDSTSAHMAPVLHQVTIGSTGLGLDLPSDLALSLAQDSHYVFATITPKDSLSEGQFEAVIYIGNTPNRDRPSGKYTKTEHTGQLLGRQVNWITYTTSGWQHEEVIVDYRSGMQRYLHVWCNARSTVNLSRGLSVLQTLREVTSR